MMNGLRLIGSMVKQLVQEGDTQEEHLIAKYRIIKSPLVNTLFILTFTLEETWQTKDPRTATAEWCQWEKQDG